MAERRRPLELLVARRLTVVGGPLFMFPIHGLDPRTVVVRFPYSEPGFRPILQLSTPAYHTPLESVQQERYDLADHFVVDRQNALGR